MWVRSLACVAAALLLPACAGPGPGLTGNDTGGIIPSSVSRALARDMAVEHCARYGKYPVATSVDRNYGGYYAFACRFDRRARS
ncbi:MAG: hypothetical protein AB7O50_01405 [Pseudolabrys sp.]